MLWQVFWLTTIHASSRLQGVRRHDIRSRTASGWRLPTTSDVGAWMKNVAYSSGTAQDSHLVPF